MVESVDVVKRNPGGRWLALIAILFSLVAIAAAGYVYYQYDNLHNEFRQSVVTIRNVERNNQQLKLQLSRSQLQLIVIESRFDMVVKANQNFALLQLNEIISMANQSLLVYGDIKSAVKLLSYAADILNNNASAQYIEIKNAVNNDVVALGQLQYTDAIMLTSKLNAIANQISTLPLVDENEVIHVETQQNVIDKTSHNIWERFWNNFKKDIRSLVYISNNNNSNAIQLLPEKEIIIRQNLKLYLLNAKIALLQHDDQAWKYNLINIQSDLDDYFIQNSLLVSIQSNVADLLKADVTMNNININNTLKALNKLNGIQN